MGEGADERAIRGGMQVRMQGPDVRCAGTVEEAVNHATVILVALSEAPVVDARHSMAWHVMA